VKSTRGKANLRRNMYKFEHRVIGDVVNTNETRKLYYALKHITHLNKHTVDLCIVNQAKGASLVQFDLQPRVGITCFTYQTRPQNNASFPIRFVSPPTFPQCVLSVNVVTIGHMRCMRGSQFSFELTELYT
jgi:hypothetical protein